MSRRSVLTVCFLVGVSILTAWAYHRWQLNRIREARSGEATFASFGGDESLESGAWRSAKPSLKIDPSAGPGALEAGRCQCTKLPPEHASFAAEDIGQCAESRRAVALEFERFPPLFRDSRARRSAEFPRLCLTYMMKRPFPAEDSEPGAALVDCGSGAKAPGARVCATETVINVAYNLFADVTSCLGVPQKELLPKIMADSSFHMNVASAAGGTGIGRLTPAARDAVDSAWNGIVETVKTSESESCRNLRPFLKAADKEGSWCGPWGADRQPLRQMVEMAFRYARDSAIVREFSGRHDVEGLMRRAGLVQYEHEQLLQLLTLLAHQTGPVTAVIYLKNYLEHRIEAQKEGRAPLLGISDFDFSSRAGRVPSSDARILTFAEYLELYQIAGEKGYPRRVKQAADRLNQVFEEGVCVSDSYLSLSL